MKYFIYLLLFIVGSAHAEVKFDGNWVRRVVPLQERVSNSQSVSDRDFNEVMLFLGYVRGVVSAEQSKARVANMYAASLKDVQAGDIRIKLALAFSPFAFVPDDIRMDQIVKITSLYVERNPKRWNESAYSLLIDAVKEAYPLNDE